MSKQIVITGGLGFIGHHLVRKLIADDYFPIIIDNFSNSNKFFLKYIPVSKFFLIKSEINDFKKIKNGLRRFNPQVIIHLAALHFIPYCDSHPCQTFAVNVIGTQTILEIAVEMKIKNFLFISSADVYKYIQRPLKECDPSVSSNIYGFSKKLGEDLVLFYSKKFKIRHNILRLFNVYGADDTTPHFIPAVLSQLRRANKIKVGNLNSFRDYIYIDDVVEAIMRVITKSTFNNTVYNIGTGKQSSGRQIIQIFEKFLSKKIVVKQESYLIRQNDRLKLVACIERFSRDYCWYPQNTLYDGLQKLILQQTK